MTGIPQIPYLHSRAHMGFHRLQRHTNRDPRLSLHKQGTLSFPTYRGVVPQHALGHIFVCGESQAGALDSLRGLSLPGLLRVKTFKSLEHLLG